MAHRVPELRLVLLLKDHGQSRAQKKDQNWQKGFPSHP